MKMKKKWIKIKQFIIKKEIVQIVTFVLALVLFYGVLHFFGITCPIKFITGVSCAGCGMTRAWLSILHFNFAQAFYYHPLFWMPPIVLVVVLFKTKINKKLYTIFIFTTIIMFVIIYLYRIISGNNDIVVIEVENGFIFRVIKYIFK